MVDVISIMSTAATVHGLGLQVYQHANTIDINSRKCRQLAKRVKLIVDLIGELNDVDNIPIQQQQQYFNTLLMLQDALQDALELLNQFNQSFLISRVVCAGNYQDELNIVSQKLADCVQQLNLSLTIKQVCHQQKLEKARRQDQYLLLSNQDQIIKQTQSMNSMIQQLQQTNITPISASADQSTRIAMVIKPIQQRTLRQLLHTQTQLTTVARHQLVLSIALGLAYLHNHNITHGHLTSDHVLIDSDGCAGLIHPELSSIADQANISEYTTCDVSPESQADDSRGNLSNDVYQFGVILWEMMTGCEAIDADYDDSMIPETVLSLYRKIMTSCWQVDPAQRPKINNIVELLQINIPTAIPIIHDHQSLQQTTPTHVNSNVNVFDAEMLYQDGCDCEQRDEFKQAIQYYQRAAEHDHAKAITKLALFYLYGHGVSQDKQRAHHLFKQAANTDYSVAMYNLAHQFELGDGIEQNLEIALHWYERLAKQDDQQAKMKCEQLASAAIIPMSP